MYKKCYKANTRYLGLSFLSMCLLIFAGCDNSLNLKHPSLSQSDSVESSSRVYLLHSELEHFMGFPGNALSILVDNTPMLEIDVGSFDVIYLRSGKTSITVESRSIRGREQIVEEMRGSSEFNFKPGKDYFVFLKLVDGEFRGTYFKPVLIDLVQAKSMAKNLRPAKEITERDDFNNMIWELPSVDR